MAEDDVLDILLQIWGSCYFEHPCICWAVDTYICAPFEEQVSCIETIHQSLQDEGVNNLHQFNWWGCCKSSSSNTFALLTVPGLMDKTCHKISASTQQIRFFFVSSAHLECKPPLGMSVDSSAPWILEFSLIPVEWEIEWETQGTDQTSVEEYLTFISVSFCKVLKTAQLVMMKGSSAGARHCEPCQMM